MEPLDISAVEIVDQLEAALEEFRSIEEDIQADLPLKQIWAVALEEEA